MKPKAITLLALFILFIPVVAQEQNIIIDDTNGVVQAGSWFYYRITLDDNYTYYANCTIISINSSHIIYNTTRICPSNTRTYTVVVNTSKGVTFFWINTTLFCNFAKSVNNTEDFGTIYMVKSNESYINFIYVFPRGYPIINHKIWFDSNHIITRHWYHSYFPNTTKTQEREELHILESLWSPALNRTQTETSIPEDVYVAVGTVLILFAISAMVLLFKKLEKESKK